MMKNIGFKKVENKNISYFRNSSHVFEASSKTKNREDPYSKKSPQDPIFAESLHADLRSKINPSVAEFITLSAAKP
jgi:hypothetical protein